MRLYETMVVDIITTDKFSIFLTIDKIGHSKYLAAKYRKNKSAIPTVVDRIFEDFSHALNWVKIHKKAVTRAINRKDT